MSFIKGLTEKDHHLTISPDGSLGAAKNTKACCGCSKALATQTRNDKEAVSKLAARFERKEDLGVDDLKLYSSVQAKYKSVDGLISGLINWFKKIFRSKDYKTELKELRSELDKFRGLFSKQRMIASISAKYFPRGHTTDNASDKKALEQLKKEVPELFNDKLALSENDFKGVPFLIRQSGGKYQVNFAPAAKGQKPEAVWIDCLNQLPDIENRERLKQQRERAKQLFEGVRLQGSYVGRADCDYSCENAVGKVELTYAEDFTALDKNELSITYYVPGLGLQHKKIDLNSVDSGQLDTIIQTCKRESTDAQASIEIRLNELKDYLKDFNLIVEVSLSSHAFIVKEGVYKPQLFFWPLSSTLDQSKVLVQQQIQELYLKSNPELVSYEHLKTQVSVSDLDRIGLKVNLEARRVEIRYYDFTTRQLTYKEILAPFQYQKAHRSEISAIVKEIQKNRVQPNTLTAILAQGVSKLRIDTEDNCRAAVGNVELSHNATTCLVTIKYFKADTCTLITKVVSTSSMDDLRQAVITCKQESTDSIKSIESKITHIRAYLPACVEVGYSFYQRRILVDQREGPAKTHRIASFRFDAPLDAIQRCCEKEIAEYFRCLWNMHQSSSVSEVLSYKLATYEDFLYDKEDLEYFGVKYNQATKKIELYFFDHQTTQKLDFNPSNTKESNIAQLAASIALAISERKKDQRPSVLLAEGIRQQLFPNNFGIKLAPLFRNLVKKSFKAEDLIAEIKRDDSLILYGVTESADALKMLLLLQTYQNRVVNSENSNWIGLLDTYLPQMEQEVGLFHSPPPSQGSLQSPPTEIIPLDKFQPLDPSHPIEKRLNPLSFMRGEYAKSTQGHLNQYIQTLGVEALLDQTFLSLPLSHWVRIYRETPEKIRAAWDIGQNHALHQHLAVLDLPEHKSKNDVVLSRVLELDKTVHLFQRLESLNYPDHIQIRDVIEPWNSNWILKFGIMIDEELRRLTVSDFKDEEIGKLSAKDLDRVLCDRVTKSVESTSSYAVSDPLENLRLVDVPRLSANQINAHHEQLPLIAFYLVSSCEISEVNLENLSEPKLNAIYSSNQRVKALGPAQIQKTITRVKKEMIESISAAQILKLDFTTFAMNPDIFKALFSTKMDAFKQLPVETLYVLAPFFQEEHWKELSENQLLNLDYSKIEKMDSQKFNWMFSWLSKEKVNIFKKLPVDKLYQLFPFFQEGHWKELSEKQTLELDYLKMIEDSKIKFDSQKFNWMFSWLSKEKVNIFKKLPVDKLYQLFPFFQEGHWKELSEKQTLELDYLKMIEDSKIKFDSQKFNWMFNWFSKEKVNIFKKLPVVKLSQLTKFFTKGHWESFAKRQVLEFDYAKLNGDQNKFDLIFKDSSKLSWISELTDLQLKLIKGFLKSRADLVSKLKPHQKALVS